MHRTCMKRLLIWLWLSAAAVQAHAAMPSMLEAVHATLQEHPSLATRQFDVQISRTSPSPQSHACDDWKIDLPIRDRMLGPLRVQARCLSNPRLNKTLQVVVQATAPVFVAARNLAPGQPTQASDWKIVSLDLGMLPADVIEDEENLKNKEIVRYIRAGTPLRLNDFRAMTVIRIGDQVKLSLVGQGFSVTSMGQAMTHGAVGGTVRVRTTEGKVLQGTVVSAGEVEVILD